MSASRPRGSGPRRHELDEQASEADRLGDELAPHELVARGRRVALVEDEVDDGHHGVEALGQLVVVGHAVRDAARRGSSASRARAAAPSWRRARGTRARSPRSQARERAQRERDLRLDGERRVAAGEDEAQAIVGPCAASPRRRVAVVGEAARGRRAARPAGASRARRRRSSTALLRAARMSHARGLSGRPSRGHCRTAASKAASSASSARSKSPRTRISVARTRPRSSRKTASMVARGVHRPLEREHSPSGFALRQAAGSPSAAP